ncbi:hypothetical protein EMCRGX_G010947 [Ephydatia muelleri]
MKNQYSKTSLHCQYLNWMMRCGCGLLLGFGDLHECHWLKLRQVVQHLCQDWQRWSSSVAQQLPPQVTMSSNI